MSESGEEPGMALEPRLPVRLQHSRDLWSKAIQSLSVTDRQLLDVGGVDQSTTLHALLETVHSKQQICIDKQWRYTRRNGEVVMLRDAFGKLVGWIKRFQAVGDSAMQYDPTHASLPWACVRLLLQVAINDIETYGTMIEGLESISRYIAKYAKVEEVYLHRGTILQDHLEACITELYVAVLMYLSKARAYYDRRSSVRLVRSIVQSASSVEKSHGIVAIKAKQVDELTQILDADCTISFPASFTADVGLVARKTTGFMFEGFRGLDARFDRLDDRVSMLGSTLVRPEVARETLITWLNAVSTDEELERACSERTPETCQWILGRDTFKEWLSQDQKAMMKLLWVRGSRGVGKTVLCASILRHLQRQYPSRVAFFFCTASHKAKQQTESIVRSWATQAVNQDEGVRKYAADVYYGKEHRLATSSDAWQIFRRSCERNPSPYFIIDGFDECVNTANDANFMQGPDASEFLRDLIDAVNGTSARILIVSRDDASLRSHLRDLIKQSTKQFLEYEITESDTEEDIKAFSQYTVAQKLPRKPEDLRKEVAAEASLASGGMFLWIRMLKSRLDPTENAKGLRNIVKKMPRELEQTYDAEMERMYASVDTRAQAISILRWVLYSQRPLTVREILEAVVINVDDDCPNYPAEDLPDSWDEHEASDRIRRLCGSLLELRSTEETSSPQYHTVHFVHFSVREYLSSRLTTETLLGTSPHISDPVGSHDLLAQSCLRLFDYLEFRRRPALVFEEVEGEYQKCHFLKYAAVNWPVHARFVSSWSDQLVRMTRKFFQPEHRRWIFWGRIFAAEMEKSLERSPISIPDNASSIFYLSLLGLFQELRHLDSLGYDVASCSNGELTPLHAAAAMGHQEIVEFFSMHGANLNVASKDGYTPLHLAADRNQLSVVQYLLENGAVVDANTAGKQTPLHFAAYNGHLRILDVLVEYGAQVDVPERKGYSPMRFATLRGHIEVVKKLLGHGARIEQGDDCNGTLLHDAAASGNYDLFKLLLQYTAKTDAADDSGWYIIHAAAQGGDKGIVEYLIRQGVSPNKEMPNGGTPIIVAAANGHFEIVELLESLGGSLHRHPGKPTPLFAAALLGHLETVQYLLLSGVGIDGKEPDGATALHAAAAKNHADVIQLLVKREANVNILNDSGFAPLHEAARAGHLHVVRSLLSCESLDRTIRTSFGQATALMLAAGNDHREVVEMLAAEEPRSYLELQDKDGWTAICYAVYGNRLEIVKLLLKLGAILESKQETQHTLLQLAVRSDGNLETAQFLLEADPEILTSTSPRGETAAHTAAYANNVEALRLLMNVQSTSVDAVDPHGWNALHLAVAFGNIDVVSFLTRERPALLHTRTCSGGMPHHIAAEANLAHAPQLCQILVQQDRSLLDVVDGGGLTPIHRAAICGHAEVVRVLAGLASTEKNETGDDPTWSGQSPSHSALYHGQFESLKVLLEFDRYGGVDWYGRTVVDWILALDPELLTELGISVSEAQYQTTPPEVQQKAMRRSVILIAKRILESADRLNSLSPLGRFLLHLNRPEDAMFCFQLQISPADELVDGERGTDHDVICDHCDQTPIHGARFVCMACPDTDLCSVCMSQYAGSEKRSLCNNHQFLEIVQPGPFDSGAEDGSGLEDEKSKRKRIDAWLTSLIELFDEAESIERPT